ncbi:MAG: recombinase family protein [Anaerolineae bacterium]|nr:recombinase family protein [Anaerolineae bacterium]
MTKTILYTRVSTDDQKDKGVSLDVQSSKVQAYATLNDMRVIAEFADDFSGTKLERPAFKKVLALLREGKAKALVCYDNDRLTRNPTDYMLLRDEFAQLGVELHYVTRGKINLNDEIMQGVEDFQGRFAKQWLKKIVQGCTDGRREKARQGGYMGHGQTPYGYDVVKDGKLFKLVINEGEAEIVLLIFRLYVFGDESGPMSIKEIANHLNLLSIPPAISKRNDERKASRWQVWRIADILKSRVYLGEWYYAKDSDNPIKVSIPAIVEQEIFDAASARRIKNKKGFRATRIGTHQALVRGCVVCGHCGYAMYAMTTKTKTGKYYTYYVCGCAKGVQYNGTCENRHHFNAQRIDADIWQRLKGLLTDKDKFDRAIDELNQNYDTQNQEIIDELNRVETSIAKRNKELEKAVDGWISMEKGTTTKEYLKKRCDEIELNLAELQAKKEKLQGRLSGQRLTQDRVTSLSQTVLSIGRGLEKADHIFEARRQLVADIFNVKVALSFDGQEDIQATCELGPLENYEPCRSILQ